MLCNYLYHYFNTYSHNLLSSPRLYWEAYTTIRSSNLFDYAFYQRRNNRSFVSDLIQDYLQYGLFEGRNPATFFDSIFYLVANQDVMLHSVNPLTHYVMFGQFEGRVCNEVNFLISNFNFNVQYYNLKNGTDFTTEQDIASHYCSIGWHLGDFPAPHFDTNYYVKSYPSSIFKHISPLTEFILCGSFQEKSTISSDHKFICFSINELTEQQLEDYICIKRLGQFDYAYYMSQSNDHYKNEESALLDYVINWHVNGLNPTKFFNSLQYSRENYISNSNPYSVYLKESDQPKLLRAHNWTPSILSSKWFSIILPTKNRADTIKMAIDSVLSQTFKNYELLIVDDHSNDGTQLFVNQQYSDFMEEGRLRYMINGGHGVSAARNTGIMNSSHELIAYIDSDVSWDSEWLVQLACAYKSNKNMCGYGKINVHDLVCGINYTLGRPFSFDILKNNNYVDMNAFTHSKSLFYTLGGFNINLKRFVDWDLVLRYTKKFQPFFIDKVAANYFILPNFSTITSTEADTTI